MPATKELPNLRLLHHFPDVAGGQTPGAVVPAHAVGNPDAMVAMEAAAWTGDPVTVNVSPPGAKPSAMSAEHLATADELAAIRKQAEEVGEAKLKAEDEASELRKALAKANADAARADATAKELADLKAAVAKAKSLKEAQEAVK